MNPGCAGFSRDRRSSVKLFLSNSVLALLLVLGAAPSLAQTTPAPATFLEPGDGGILDPSLRIRWTPQPDALAYFLYVGTAPGLKDLISSNETQATEWSARALPA